MNLSAYLLYTAIISSLGAVAGWWIARDLYLERPTPGQKVEAMKNLLPILFAPILLGLISFASPQEGSVGTEPQLVVSRTLVGVPGVKLTAQRDGVLVIARSDDWGTQDASAPPPTVITTSWTSSGLVITVTVTQGPN